jgi:hypothetical protein
MDLMLQPLRKYAEFTGRARRSEFWLFWLCVSPRRSTPLQPKPKQRFQPLPLDHTVLE